MCGRYVLKASRHELVQTFSLAECVDFDIRYNIAPLQFSPVIRQRPNGDRVAHLLRWGLVPSWSEDEAAASRLINARAETLAGKPSFRTAFRSRRCIVPASGFYEWQARPTGKQPYYIHPKEGSLFGFAGLWERWTRADGEALDSFAIITTRASPEMRELHERMPLILCPEDYRTWLDRESDADTVRRIAGLANTVVFEAVAVSRAVSNARNEGASLIAPAEPG